MWFVKLFLTIFNAVLTENMQIPLTKARRRVIIVKKIK